MLGPSRSFLIFAVFSFTFLAQTFAVPVPQPTSTQRLKISDSNPSARDFLLGGGNGMAFAYKKGVSNWKLDNQDLGPRSPLDGSGLNILSSSYGFFGYGEGPMDADKLNNVHAQRALEDPIFMSVQIGPGEIGGEDVRSAILKYAGDLRRYGEALLREEQQNYIGITYASDT